MILRRIAENIKQQHWTGIVIELAIVVVGVFLGMQVSNWNEERENDQKSAIFTQRLNADLRMEAWNYQAQIDYNEQVLANAMRAADALTGKTPLADEALLIAAYRATQYNGSSHRRATYDELTSTGEISLIRDEALRTLAMDIYTQPQVQQIDQHGQESDYRKAFRMALPYEIQLGLQGKCGDQVVLPGDYAGLKTVLDYPCTTGLAPDVIASGAAILRKDPKFVALLQLRITDIKSDLGNLTTYFGYIREPLQRIAKEKQ